MPKMLDRIEIEERCDLSDAGANVRITADGYLVAAPRIARTGIQLYSGREVGRDDLEQVRVYRPAEQVFDKAAMTSLAWRPVTLEHPDDAVNAKNWKQHAVGHIAGEVARDGDYIRVPLALMDHDAIAEVQNGRAQLSVGYGAKLVWGDGMTPDGEAYDAVQTDIRANHVAIVAMARGGDKLKIGDRKRIPKQRGVAPRKETTTMSTKTIDGVQIELDDKDGQILDRFLGGLQSKLADSEKKVGELSAQVSTLGKTLENKDGEIIGLTKKLADAEWTPLKRDQSIRESMEVFDRARRVLGDKLVTDGKSDMQIKREVVAVEIGDDEAKAMSDEAIAGVFRAVTRQGQNAQKDGLQRTIAAFSKPLPAPAMTPSQAAYAKYVDGLNNAYKAKSA